MNGWVSRVLTLLGVALIATGIVWVIHDEGSTPPPGATLAAPPPTTPVHIGPKSVCEQAARRPFVPTRISVAHVTSGSPVLALPRDEANVPGVPPLTEAGKEEFAWDAPGIKPGAARGNVVLNAHTWPDGSAMGNRLLARLHAHDRFVLRGHRGSRLCYRVTDRIEVSIKNPPLDRVYDATGRPQAVIIVCSGERTGPGEWSRRTIWFASPIDQSKPSAG
jgi:hypothetical protein